MFDAKKDIRWSRLKVGLVITLALLVLLIAVFFAGGIGEIFSPKVELKVQSRDVKGLRKGAPVWIFGTEVGSVKEIRLDPAFGTVITISVHKDAAKFIKKDAQASIMTMGLLGDKYIEISNGSSQAAPIRPGDMIRGKAQIEFSDIMGTAALAIDKMGEFITKLETLLTEIEEGEGTIAKFFKDPSIYENLEKTTRSLSIVLENIKTSQGTMRLFIEDPSLYNKLLKAASSIEEFSGRLNESHGALKKLVEDPSLYDKTLSAVSWIEEFSKKLNESPGTLKKLVEDPELYDNLNRDSKDLASILEKIDRGDGLAGALIQDQELVKELKETFSKFNALAVEVDGLAEELKALTKDIKEHPKKYFKFSVF